jgi:hypothetical protein
LAKKQPTKRPYIAEGVKYGSTVNASATLICTVPKLTGININIKAQYIAAIRAGIITYFLSIASPFSVGVYHSINKM